MRINPTARRPAVECVRTTGMTKCSPGSRTRLNLPSRSTTYTVCCGHTSTGSGTPCCLLPSLLVAGVSSRGQPLAAACALLWKAGAVSHAAAAARSGARREAVRVACAAANNARRCMGHVRATRAIHPV